MNDIDKNQSVADASFNELLYEEKKEGITRKPVRPSQVENNLYGLGAAVDTQQSFTILNRNRNHQISMLNTNTTGFLG
jgi:hypothetical protein